MTRRLAILIGLIFTLAACARAANPGTNIPEQYRVDPVQWPNEDRSGEVGQRLLRLLSTQVANGLRWIDKERAASGVGDDRFVIRCVGQSRLVRAYDLCQTANCIHAMTILARCGKPGQSMAGTMRENLERTSVILLKAILDTHPAGGSPSPQADLWGGIWGMRMQYHIGMGAWLIWDLLDAQTQLRVAKVLEHDADLFLGIPAPAQLRDDTKAESNAWNGAGMAAVACMFKHHPHHAAWDDKAKELMLSAYATQSDVDSSRVVDGKPLNQWLTGPNALSDYTVENHGFIHPDYIAAASELGRSVISYRLAGEPIPEASTFNADKTLDVLMWMTLPAGHYLYAQGTDYCTKRLDSFFQACNVIPLKPDPLRNAFFLRTLTGIEKMASDRPNIAMSGWLGCPFEFGMFWGLTENYMMRRFFGPGCEALPDSQIEKRLSGVRVFKEGMFAIHRTSTSISSFSWHSSAKRSRLMGMTLPLDRDAIVYPMPGSLIGELHEADDVTKNTPHQSPEVRSHKVDAGNDSLGVMLELHRCGGKVLQHCAFVSLPDGTSVYIEQRIAGKKVSLAKVASGNIVINDDIRWVFQSKPRRFVGQSGEMIPSDSSLYGTNWFNVDDRQGYVTLGNARLRLTKEAGQPGIWRGTGTIYDTCRLEFVQLPHDDKTQSAPAHFDAGQRVGVFALVALPSTKADDTRSLAQEIIKTGWVADDAGCLAVKIKGYLVYANFAASSRRITTPVAKDIPAGTCGWVATGATSRP